MFSVIIKQPDKADSRAKLVPGVYRLGSSPASHIQFNRPEISSKHALMTVSDNSLKMADVGSTNISRFRHGLILLKMVTIGFLKVKSR